MFLNQIQWPNELTSNISVREVEFGLVDGAEDGQYTDIGLVKISKTFAMQNECFF